MRPFRIAALALFFFLATANSPQSEGFTRMLPLPPDISQLGQHAEVDWTGGTVRARGAGTAAAGLTLAQAKLRARGAARADALRLLAVAIGEVRITSDTLVQDYVLAYDTVRVQIDTLLRSVIFPEDQEVIEQLADGSFIVYSVAEIRLYGTQSPTLAGVVYPFLRESEQASAGSYLPPSPGSPSSQPSTGQSPAPPGDRSEEADAGDNYTPAGHYTGLIIDASNFYIDPTMAPRVYSTTGAIVYGVLATTTEYANDIGVVGYHRSVETARTDPRVGSNPLVVSAVGVEGSGIFSEHPIITDTDARLVLAEDTESAFLDQAKVVIVGQ